MRPWTGPRTRPAMKRYGPLQWGHGLAAVDGPPPSRRLVPQRIASMGPRPCGRGRTHGRGRSTRAHLASMGPRPCGRGRAVGAPLCTAAAKLQWGHGLAAVDGPWRAATMSVARTGFNGATALRPWTAGGRGPDMAAHVLQWGHGLAAVDGCIEAICHWSHEMLQWGHGLAAVDGRRQRRP